MSQIMDMYRTMGIRPSVYEFGTNIEKELKIENILFEDQLLRSQKKM